LAEAGKALASGTGVGASAAGPYSALATNFGVSMPKDAQALKEKVLRARRVKDLAEKSVITGLFFLLKMWGPIRPADS
jgi:hypothetical protein